MNNIKCKSCVYGTISGTCWCLKGKQDDTHPDCDYRELKVSQYAIPEDSKKLKEILYTEEEVSNFLWEARRFYNDKYTIDLPYRRMKNQFNN